MMNLQTEPFWLNIPTYFFLSEAEFGTKTNIHHFIIITHNERSKEELLIEKGPSDDVAMKQN